MTGIRFVADEKGRKVGVLIDLKTRGRLGGLPGRSGFGIAPKRESHSLRAIPRNPPETHSHAW
jgi:hypothetical protein